MPHNPKKKTTRRKSKRRAIKDDTPEDLAKNESPESVLASSSCLRNDSLETALDSLELSTASSGAPEIIATETHTTIDQQGGKEEKKEREADSISLTASIVNEEEEIKNLDSEEDHELALPDGVEKIPEYTDVLKEDMYSFQIDEPELSRFPDLDRLFSEVIGSIEKNFRPSHVMQELRRFYDLLVQYRQNENNILEKLKSREEELKWLAHKTKRDPRLMKIIQLADGWRQERAEVEKRNVELICQVDLLHGDLRCMEQSTQIMQLNLERMQGELKENEENTSDLKQCQDTAMEREGRLNFLEYSLHHLQSEAKEKQKQHEEALQSLEQCEGELRSMITLETKFRQKEHENRNLVAERDLLKSQVAGHNSNAENSQKRLIVMDRTMTDLKCKLKAFKTNVSHMEVTVKKLNRHLANKRNQCSVLEEEKDRALHDVELLKMKVKEGEDEIKKINTKLKDRNILLHHKERKLKDIKEKLETVEERETVARKETVALNKTICNMERRETTAKREIDLMNTKIINADVRLRKEMTSLTLASSKADGLAKSLDVTLVQLKNCTSRNNSLRAEQLDADSRLKTFQALCDDHVRTIAQGEKNMASLIHNTKKLDQEVTKYRDTVFMLRGKNQVLTADAFSQLETTRILQKHLESTAKEGKSMMKAMDDQEKVLLSLRKAELKARSQLAQLEIENNAQKNTLERAVDQLGIQKTEASNLMMALRKVEEELRSSIVRETALCRDRDIFATRVIQGNIKLELQTIKLRHMEDVIMKGNKDYEDRITDITLLRREIRTLRRKLKLLDNTKYVNSELRTELTLTKRNLCLERNKRAAQDTFIPTRVHNVQKLKANFPSEYEQILKNQHLIRRLIAKSDYVVVQEHKIMSLQRSLMELKIILASRSPPGLAYTITTTKADNSAKDKQIKSLISELNMTRHDLEVAKLNSSRHVKSCGENRQITTVQITQAKRPRDVQYNPKWKCPPRVRGGGFLLYTPAKSRRSESVPSQNMGKTDKKSERKGEPKVQRAD